jgi:hypothetical protein
MSLFFQSFVLIGCCLILKYGSILNPIRNFLTKMDFFKKLFKCCMCLGFWVGGFFGIFWSGSLWMIPLWGFYSSSICWFADYMTMVLDKYLDDGKVDP